MNAAEQFWRLVQLTCLPMSLNQRDGFPFKNAAWPILLPWIEQHGIGGLVFEGLGDKRSAVPAEVLEQMKRQAQVVLVTSGKTVPLFLKTHAILKDAGISLLAMKGHALAQRLYGNAWIRPCSDVDWLVPLKQFPHACEVIEKAGFRPHRDEGMTDVFDEHHHLGFEGKIGTVELHFRLFSGFGNGVLDDEACWSNMRQIEVEGIWVNVLAAHFELAYLAVHAANHLFSRGVWLVDIAALSMKMSEAEIKEACLWAKNSSCAVAMASAAVALERCFGMSQTRSWADALKVEPWRWLGMRALLTPNALAEQRWLQRPALSPFIRSGLSDDLGEVANSVIQGLRRRVRRLVPI